MKVKLELSDYKVALAQRNAVGLRGNLIMCGLISVAYLLECFKGDRTIGQYLFLLSLVLIPALIATYIYYKKSKDAISIRYLCGIGFMAMYTYIVFSTDNDLVFCYAIVIFILQTVYVDLKYSLVLGIYTVLLTVVDVIRQAVTLGLRGKQITYAEIKIACLILTTYFMVIVLKKIIQINDANMEKIRQEKEQSQKLLEMVLSTANSITENIAVATEQTEQLNDEIDSTQISMKELSAETSEAGDAIKEQQIKTSEIDGYVGEVNKSTDMIVNEISNAENNIREGENIINHLLEQVNVSEKSSALVAKEMEGLKENAKKMQGMVDVISDVANQTVLLALNANIEAARSGEAGKGFAVVASEISNLANQTEIVTNDINKIFENVGKSIVEVVKSIDDLFESNKYQTEYIEKTVDNFKEIHNNTKEISMQAEILKTTVNDVLDANKLVMDNIDNVSNVTGEVTRSASKTLDSCNMNLELIAKVRDIMQKLDIEAKQLQQKSM